MTKRNIALFAIGAVVLTGSAIVAYIKREAIKQATDDIVGKLKKRLNNEDPALAE